MMDLHTHTQFSDGKSTLSDMLSSAFAYGTDVIAITDHFDRNDYRENINSITEEALFKHYDAIKKEAKKYPGMRVLCGIETSPLPNGMIDVAEEVRNRSDVIITSCHYIYGEYGIQRGKFFNDDYWNAYKEYMLHMAAGDGDILGHLEGYLPIRDFIEGMGTDYQQRKEICLSIVNHYCDETYIDSICEALLSSGKACELHVATHTPREWVIERLGKAGVPFTFGSDAHAKKDAGRTDWAQEMAGKYALTLRRF